MIPTVPIETLPSTVTGAISKYKILRKLEFNLSFQKSRVMLMKTDERSV